MVIAVLLAIGKYLINLFIGSSDVASDFGVAASLVIILIRSGVRIGVRAAYVG